MLEIIIIGFFFIIFIVVTTTITIFYKKNPKINPEYIDVPNYLFIDEAINFCKSRNATFLTN